MTVTFSLTLLVVLLGIALAWRVYRWRWRPRLTVDPEPRRDSSSSETVLADANWLLGVRNSGPAEARRCRASLLRVSLDEGGTWRRVEPDPDSVPVCWSDGAMERDLAAGENADIVVVRGNALPAGRYWFEVAVINGEETRTAFEIAISGLDRPERKTSEGKG
jgi:hypothetical protein